MGIASDRNKKTIIVSPIFEKYGELPTMNIQITTVSGPKQHSETGITDKRHAFYLFFFKRKKTKENYVYFLREQVNVR